ERAAEQRLEPLWHLDERVEIDPGLDAFPLEQEDEILGGDVPGRARRVGAAAQAADRSVEHGGAGFERSKRVRVAGVARVVPVEPNGLVEGADPRDQGPNGGRR